MEKGREREVEEEERVWYVSLEEEERVGYVRLGQKKEKGSGVLQGVEQKKKRGKKRKGFTQS